MEKLRKKSGTAQNCTKKQPPRFAAQNCAVKRGGRLCPLAGCNSIACDRHVVSSLMSYRPLAGCDVMRLATFSKFKWNFQRPLVGCDYIANNYIDPETRCNFQRPLAGCDWTARKTYGTTFRLILRPLAGCNSSCSRMETSSRCGFLRPLMGLVNVVSYVPLRGVI